MNSTPIIQSLLDTDAYKLYMHQAVWHHYPEVEVTAEFHCRDEEPLLEYKDELIEQLKLFESLRLSTHELEYLRSLAVFSEDYLEHLSRLSFDSRLVEVAEEQGKLAIRIQGPWHQVILWETPLLAVLCEIRNRHLYPELGVEQALQQLENKIRAVKASYSQQQLAEFDLIEFGTRRRFSLEVQRAINRYLLAELPHSYRGTSNLQQAMELEVAGVGTQAHEWFQAHQQLCSRLEDSQRRALEVWLEEYPAKLGIALTDCISMDAFLADFDLCLAKRYQGLRHDSGDPVIWGEKAIAHYQELGIDPMSKLLVFSDSLTLDRAIELSRYFHGRINTSFGIGTQLSCDLPSVKPMNIVLKLTECNGGPVAKISDSPGKSICRDELFIQRLKQAFKLTK
ncbi:nicotinate phosphoribosyltransferase [Dongshaea marina]|uniref:nicotinate phosphoribosyltransferase n=1 Tax=Dongshaea marina TaxID=2047966 RepID=UPI000D3E2EF4|nr:nicotinate phosphoribosyltransferase [Dongshaea marina]